MDLRHEWKHEINYSDMIAIRQRLRAVAKVDSHAVNGKYFIRSLYFDDLSDRALREKLDGVNIREKFRIRYYNGDLGFIQLEKKSKINGLCQKVSERLTPEEAEAIVRGETGSLDCKDRPLLGELCFKMKAEGLMPKTVVDYTREPFVFAPGNVRVTMDYDIRTGIRCTDFLNSDIVTVPVRESPIILEVKWDSFLPTVIKDAVQLEGRHAAAFSKYAACRVYG